MGYFVRCSSVRRRLFLHASLVRSAESTAHCMYHSLVRSAIIDVTAFFAEDTQHAKSEKVNDPIIGGESHIITFEC